MIVVYSASRNLYPYMLPSIMSLLKHNPQVEKIYLLIEDDQMPYEVPEVCECINVSGQTWFPRDGANFRSNFTYLSLLRVCYGKLLPESVDRVIQLDVDTIVEDSLQPIWEVDLTDKWFAAVPETLSRYKPFGDVYYNIGVAVFNLAQIRRDGVEDALILWLNNHETPYIDQDAWNMFGARTRAVALDARYNECFVTESSSSPAVVHYAGIKMWWNKPDLFRGWYLDDYKCFYKEGCV